MDFNDCFFLCFNSLTRWMSYLLFFLKQDCRHNYKWSSLQRWLCPMQRWLCPLQRWLCPLQRWICPLQRWLCLFSKDDNANCKDDNAHCKDDYAHCKDDYDHCKDDNAHCKDDYAHCKDEDAHFKDDNAHSKDGMTMPIALVSLQWPCKLCLIKYKKISMVNMLKLGYFPLWVFYKNELSISIEQENI